jgi:hypothetical protein
MGKNDDSAKARAASATGARGEADSLITLS